MLSFISSYLVSIALLKLITICLKVLCKPKTW